MTADAIKVRLTVMVLGLVAAAAGWSRELPDFTELVAENAPAVVNISTVQHRDNDRGLQSRDDLEEFFRRFFPPGQEGPREGPLERPPVPYNRPRSLGSGFVIERNGFILTNNHVVEDADEIIVRFNDRRELIAELVGSDPRSDLALLKVEADDLPTVALGASAQLKVGEWVLAIGSPFGFDYSVTAGIVSAKGRSLPTERNENYVPYIQTDVAINPGNSGGPLFNLDGEVIGINSQIYSNSGGFMGVSFAIPIDVAMEVVRQLKETGRVSRGWLGVVIQEVNRDLAESFGLERPHGALVTRVLEGSPAQEAGLEAGDIIIRFNDTPIDFSSELPHVVGRVQVGTESRLRVVREGREMTLKVKIGELAEREDAQLGYSSSGTQQAPSRLGLRVEALPDGFTERLDIEGGVRIVEVEGPAADAGMTSGDIITRLNNQQVPDVDTFLDVVEGLPAGRSVPVLVIRDQNPRFLALRVPE